jgi:hypothetical protein
MPLGIPVLIVIAASHCLGVEEEIATKVEDVVVVSVALESVIPPDEQSFVVPAPPAELWLGVTTIGLDELTDQPIL